MAIRGGLVISFLAACARGPVQSNGEQQEVGGDTGPRVGEVTAGVIGQALAAERMEVVNILPFPGEKFGPVGDEIILGQGWDVGSGEVVMTACYGDVCRAYDIGSGVSQVEAEVVTLAMPEQGLDARSGDELRIVWKSGVDVQQPERVEVVDNGRVVVDELGKVPGQQEGGWRDFLRQAGVLAGVAEAAVEKTATVTRESSPTRTPTPDITDTLTPTGTPTPAIKEYSVTYDPAERDERADTWGDSVAKAKWPRVNGVENAGYTGVLIAGVHITQDNTGNPDSTLTFLLTYKGKVFTLTPDVFYMNIKQQDGGTGIKEYDPKNLSTQEIDEIIERVRAIQTEPLQQGELGILAPQAGLPDETCELIGTDHIESAPEGCLQVPQELRPIDFKDHSDRINMTMGIPFAPEFLEKNGGKWWELGEIPELPKGYFILFQLLTTPGN